MRIGFLIMTLTLGASLAAGVPAGTAGAQTSEADLLKRFQTHQQVHRGLSLAPVASGSAASAAAGQTTGSSAASGAGSATVGSAAATASTPRTQSQGQRTAAAATTQAVDDSGYVEMDADSQINVRIEFDFDSAVLRVSEAPKLEVLCSAIKQSDVKLFRIFGHTDASGSDRYNLNLSRLRSEEVRRHMVEKCGIEPARLEAVGLGKRHPLRGQDPASPENRRVEFQAIS